ncbi:hypothetical protein HYPSUDRAFT_171124 [Hypholoma sublateritium FD-334 SS-4]|uniref:Diacetyl reductase [(S)-acetoin forming] n=1 Tax=Hypholoma sublateritium (strain FD-334 SS-4) TaxID=945553 RepID=A0A0D2KQ39_HYPSF|nr:hypothetical protein HYPSUDRAFT_171124 [Hypholoma sublateritium FD-334 SS-4]
MSSSQGVSLVTGSGQGIGRAIALRLADDGYDVAVNDIPSNRENLETLKAEIESKGRKALVVTADVSQEDQVKLMVDTVVETLGGLDVMVANAGICIFKPFLETTVAEWDRIFSINTRGVMLCYQAAARQMIAQGRGGRIIGACSMAGKKAFPAYAAYSATKFAVRAMTQSAAAEFGKYRITVNAYCPGNIDTPMMHNMIPIIAEKTGADPEAIKKQFDSAAVVGYHGEPSDVASLVSYIASPGAHFITGQSIVCDGGVIFD